MQNFVDLDACEQLFVNYYLSIIICQLLFINDLNQTTLGLPEVFGDMVASDRCGKWYHQRC